MKKLSLVAILEEQGEKTSPGVGRTRGVRQQVFEPATDYEDEGDDSSYNDPRQNKNIDPEGDSVGDQAFMTPDVRNRMRMPGADLWRHSQVPVTSQDPNQQANDQFSQEMEQDSPEPARTGPLRPEPQMQPQQVPQAAAPWQNNSIQQIYNPRLQKTQTPTGTQVTAQPSQRVAAPTLNVPINQKNQTKVR